MSARWVIVTPAPKTARCKACKRVSNRLSVYPEGCYACLHGLVAAPSLVATSAPVRTRKARPVAVERPAFVVAGRVVTGCAADCARLPRHKGACRPTLHKREHGKMVAA